MPLRTQSEEGVLTYWRARSMPTSTTRLVTTKPDRRETRHNRGLTRLANR